MFTNQIPEFPDFGRQYVLFGASCPLRMRAFVKYSIVRYVSSLDAMPKLKMLTANNNTTGAYHRHDLSYQIMYPTCIPNPKERPRAGV